MRPVEVTLPYCEYCERVGKLPNDQWYGKGFCIGPKGGMHPRAPLRGLRFRSIGDPFPMARSRSG